MKNFGDAFILCGGKSRRMGFDKTLLKIEDEYVIDTMKAKLKEAFDHVHLSALCGAKFADFDINVVEDIYKGGFGPAAAIHASLLASSSKYIFVVAVDMPLINIDHIKHMMDTLKAIIDSGHSPHALIPRCGEFREVLYAFYSIDILPAIEKHIKNQSYKIRDILSDLDVAYLEEGESCSFDKKLTMFTNLNYVEDLEKLDQKCQSGGANL